MKPDDSISVLPDNCLLCAIEACATSKHATDRVFADECATELNRRLDGLGPVPAALRRAVRRRALARHSEAAAVRRFSEVA